jgi:hypothetical protein
LNIFLPEMYEYVYKAYNIRDPSMPPTVKNILFNTGVQVMKEPELAEVVCKMGEKTS